MSDQESMFADQESASGPQVYRPQPTNIGSYRQSNGQIQGQATPLSGGYDQGYAERDLRDEQWQAPLPDEYTGSYVGSEAQQWNDGKIRPQPQYVRSRSMHWVWVPVVAFVFIFGLISSVAYNNANSWPSSFPAHKFMSPVNQKASTFSVGMSPLLKINVGTANVHILASNDSTVVSVTTNGPDGDQINPIQDGNTINVDEPSGFGINIGGDEGTTLDITTPVNSNIDLQSAAGRVDINGVNGQVNVNMQTGQVNLSQTTLSGQSRIHTDSGSIYFDGSFDPNGSYSMSTNIGAVDVTLPPDASFNLTGDTDNIVNDFGSNAVGDTPLPPLMLHSDTGIISLHKAS